MNLVVLKGTVFMYLLAVMISQETTGDDSILKGEKRGKNQDLGSHQNTTQNVRRCKNIIEVKNM